jgi:hypothetical protein
MSAANSHRSCGPFDVTAVGSGSAPEGEVWRDTLRWSSLNAAAPRAVVAARNSRLSGRCLRARSPRAPARKKLFVLIAILRPFFRFRTPAGSSATSTACSGGGSASAPSNSIFFTASLLAAVSGHQQIRSRGSTDCQTRELPATPHRPHNPGRGAPDRSSPAAPGFIVWRSPSSCMRAARLESDEKTSIDLKTV